MSGAAVAFDYMGSLIDTTSTGPDAWLVTNRLESNLPGCTVDLRYQFQLRDSRIVDLVIEP